MSGDRAVFSVMLRYFGAMIFCWEETLTRLSVLLLLQAMCTCVL